MTISEDDLTAIEARARAATGGVWERNLSFPASGHGDDPAAITADGKPVLSTSEWLYIEDADLNFIAHAGGDNGDVLRLVAEVRRLRDAQHWVSVSEALPDSSMNILVSYRHGVSEAWYDECADEEFRWSIAGGEASAEGVTHWMPMPDKAVAELEGAGMTHKEDEMVSGYMDGRDPASPEPNANRSRSYRHGFSNGRDDLDRKPRATAHMLRQQAQDAMEADRNA